MSVSGNDYCWSPGCVEDARVLVLIGLNLVVTLEIRGGRNSFWPDRVVICTLLQADEAHLLEEE
jgi:hypothetical protein